MPARLRPPAWLGRRGVARRALAVQLLLVAVCAGLAAGTAAGARARGDETCAGLVGGCSAAPGGAARGWLFGGLGVWAATVALVVLAGAVAGRREPSNAVAVVMGGAWVLAALGLVVALAGVAV